MIFVFFFNETATTEIYTLSLHDALPISLLRRQHLMNLPHRLHHRVAGLLGPRGLLRAELIDARLVEGRRLRSEEHTSELQSRQYLVCRLLLEKKKKHTATT